MFSEEQTVVFGVFITALTMFLLAGLVVFLVFNYFKVRMRKETEILKTVFETQENERNRIAEDLHDDIGGKLSALKLHNELLLSENLPQVSHELVKKISGQIDTIVKDIRKIVRDQSSQNLLRNGINGEVHTLFSGYRNLTQIQSDVSIDELPENLIPGFQIALFRILQELLHNSMKHSAATAIILKATTSNENLKIFYADNGKGFPEVNTDSAGMGQSNIRTRAKLFKGELSISSIPKIETSFTFIFPLREILISDKKTQ